MLIQAVKRDWGIESARQSSALKGFVQFAPATSHVTFIIYIQFAERAKQRERERE